MFNVRQIVENHNKTFYDFASNTQRSVRPRLIFFGVAAGILAIAFPRQANEFLNGVLTAQAILVGFSFNVLFFLLSNPTVKNEGENTIERNLTKGKVERIGVELFYNISYYNIITISSAVLALALLSSSAEGWLINYFITMIMSSLPNTNSMVGIFSIIGDVLRIFTHTTLYFLIIESLFTFYRTVFRVSYYFEKRLDLQKK